MIEKYYLRCPYKFVPSSDWAIDNVGNPCREHEKRILARRRLYRERKKQVD
jgi:hypothetical protein